MNIAGTITNKIIGIILLNYLLNYSLIIYWIQENIKKIIHHDQVILIPGMLKHT